MTSQQTLIALTDARKVYRRITVLDLPNMLIQNGDRLVIWGGNSSGKSTLLRVLAGVTKLTQGRRVLASEARQARVAFLPQSGGLYGDLTVAENLMMLSTLLGQEPGTSGKDLLREVRKVAATEARFDELSGGLRRIAALGVLISMEPALLFLDEPFGGLDQKHVESVWKALNAYRDGAGAIIQTAHSAGDVRDHWRSVQLEEGRVQVS